jgi:threonine dehydratase
VNEAAVRLAETIVRTPLMRLKGDDGSIYLKPETLQPIGSFKVRGVGNWALSLSPEQAGRGLSTTSAGNTAQAVGYMATQLGVPSRSLVPDNLHEAKRRAIEAYGTELIGVSMTDLMLYMFEERWRSESYSYLNPWGEPLMIAGHGTIGLEVLDDLSDLDSVFVPVGGGALIAGVAATVKQIKPEVRIFGVQAEVNSALRAAFEADGPVWIEWKKTVVEGASTPVITHNMYPMLRELVDEVVVVSENEVKSSMGRLAMNDKLTTEGAGAASVAAALKTPFANRGTSVCIVSGGSVDPSLLADVIGLAGVIGSA